MTRSFLRHRALVLCLTAMLAGCSNEVDVEPGAALFRTVAQTAKGAFGNRDAPAAPAVDDLQLRAALQTEGKPILRVTFNNSGVSTFLGAIALNQGVRTWSTNDGLTVSTRDGVLLATRGFGRDLMAADAPSAAQLSRGTGSHPRLHVYLDGADQTRKVAMTCRVSSAGAETVAVLGLGYPTRHVVETCTGDAVSERNDYWFRSDGHLLQSTQFVVPGSPGVTLQAIVE